MALHEVVFAAVIVGRLLVPLAIPRYPLPGIVGALLLDASDRAIYAQFVEIDVVAYQNYDKALDIYYLTFAYVATLRNWRDPAALRIARYLWYYRLVGVALFGLTGMRSLLLVFPNVFEYFFVFYETVRLRWNVRRLSTRHLIIAAAVIWVFIKLPQEYWVHVARGDTTDFIKVQIVGAPVEVPLVEVLARNPWILAVAVGIIAVAIVGARLALRRLPPADRPLAFDADAHITESVARRIAERRRVAEPFEWPVLLEQIALVSLIAIIFAETVPGWEATGAQLLAAATFFILVNATISAWLGRRGAAWPAAFVQFAAMGLVNVSIVVAYGLALTRFDATLDISNALFFVVLLTLIVTLYDHYRAVRLLRFGQGRRQRVGTPRSGGAVLPDLVSRAIRKGGTRTGEP